MGVLHFVLVIQKVCKIQDLTLIATGLDNVLSRSTPNGASTVYYHNDGLGSAVAVTNTSGQLQASARYDTWGNIISGGNIPLYGFTGREPDATGFMYFRARYYDPVVGRFLQRDPIGFAGGLNPYAYVNNSPQNYTDPLGLVQQSQKVSNSLVSSFSGAATYVKVVGNAMTNAVPFVDAYERYKSGDFVGATFSAGVSVAAIVSAVHPVGAVVRAGSGLVKLGSLYWKASRAIRPSSNVTKGASKAPNSSPDFIVSPGGTAFPVPKGATGPTPVVNPGGKTTGNAFTGGKGGANNQVDTMRIMNPTPPRGKSPGYPNGYIKYENKAGQGVDPYTGRTLPNRDSHFPID